jgi:hypothetical protein
MLVPLYTGNKILCLIMSYVLQYNNNPIKNCVRTDQHWNFQKYHNKKNVIFYIIYQYRTLRTKSVDCRNQCKKYVK